MLEPVADSVLHKRHLNTLRLRQNGRHFADDILKCICLNENIWISIEISLKFVPKGPINNIPALGQIMAWRWPSLYLNQWWHSLQIHIGVTHRYWVKISQNLEGTRSVFRISKSLLRSYEIRYISLPQPVWNIYFCCIIVFLLISVPMNQCSGPIIDRPLRCPLGPSWITQDLDHYMNMMKRTDPENSFCITGLLYVKASQPEGIWLRKGAPYLTLMASAPRCQIEGQARM